MLARYLRFMLVLELAAYALIAEWLHFLLGWGYAPLALLAIALALAGRFAMVCVGVSIGHAAKSPRAPEHRIGALGGLKLVLREWRAVLATSFFGFPWERHALRRDPDPNPGGSLPIILVHGYFANRGYFAGLVRALESRGVGPIFTPNLTSTFATIERFSEELAAEIERVAGTGEAQVVVIAHSMGGLGARAYLRTHGAGRVRKLITIASPHHGTVHARFGAGDSARQMSRGSRFLEELREQEGLRGPGCRVTSIYTPHDNLVAPQESSVLPWAKNIAIPGRGHVDILGAPQLVEVLVAELRDCGVAVKP
jgi:PGAP1-like protein